MARKRFMRENCASKQAGAVAGRGTPATSAAAPAEDLARLLIACLLSACLLAGRPVSEAVVRRCRWKRSVADIKNHNNNHPRLLP
jgi:hypothetical protein